MIAALLPGIREVPGPLTFVGGIVVLAGILLTARR
jgi:drug/metabolite transporter (DMT)-like permease